MEIQKNPEPVDSDIQASMESLLNVLGPKRLVMLTRLVLDVRDTTGYGHVKILLAEKRVVRIKSEKSY